MWGIVNNILEFRLAHFKTAFDFFVIEHEIFYKIRSNINFFSRKTWNKNKKKLYLHYLHLESCWLFLQIVSQVDRFINWRFNFFSIISQSRLSTFFNFYFSSQNLIVFFSCSFKIDFFRSLALVKLIFFSKLFSQENSKIKFLSYLVKKFSDDLTTQRFYPFCVSLSWIE